MKKMKTLLITMLIVPVAALVLVGCGGNSDSKLTDLESKITQLENKIEQLETKNGQLENQITELQNPPVSTERNYVTFYNYQRVSAGDNSFERHDIVMNISFTLTETTLTVTMVFPGADIGVWEFNLVPSELSESVENLFAKGGSLYDLELNELLSDMYSIENFFGELKLSKLAVLGDIIIFGFDFIKTSESGAFVCLAIQVS